MLRNSFVLAALVGLAAVLASNKRITASGNFFAAPGSGSLIFNTTWNDEQEVGY